MKKQIIITAKEANEMAEQSISNFINSKTMKRVFNEIRNKASFGYKSCRVIVDEIEVNLVVEVLKQFEYKTCVYAHRHIDTNNTVTISW